VVYRLCVVPYSLGFKDMISIERELEYVKPRKNSTGLITVLRFCEAPHGVNSSTLSLSEMPTVVWLDL